MAKKSASIVGKVKNKNFAFFWLLIGGGLGNILMILYSLDIWLIFLPSAILSILMAMAVADKKQRPKLWLGIDMVVTFILSITLLLFLGAIQIKLAIFLPNLLIMLGCILGIMNW